MNSILQCFARDWLKNHLKELPPEWVMTFKRMYSNGDLEKPVDRVVDSMSESKLDWAMVQVANSHKKLVDKTDEKVHD